MTGFGKATKEIAGKKITIEIRSINSKQFDLNLRMPSSYREKESDIRKEILSTLERGKIDFLLFTEAAAALKKVSLDKEVAKAYYHEIKSLSDELNLDQKDILTALLKLPDVISAEREEPDENEWEVVKSAFTEALTAANNFRVAEGKELEKDFKMRIGTITDLLEKIKEFESERIETIKTRISGNLAEVIPTDKTDKNRFEQELIYYLEKIDITEEKLRLKTHCDYFITTMKENSAGRKLGFITQEIGREINTIGSKANHAEIQHLVVQMKDELEKIKEQLLNIL
ncbi:MAG: hypothetical protein POELPBGB_01643 [Bacteroidia bacterium]|nr:hypothetical protein [Bacteroidia bacterium]